MVRQNFCEACEVAINHQINMELYACYVYLSMVSTTTYHLFSSLLTSMTLFEHPAGILF